MHDITLFGEVRCHKTRFYQSALEERGLAYELAEVDKDPRGLVPFQVQAALGCAVCGP